MSTVVFLPTRATAAVPAGTPLLDAAAAAGVVIHAPCGGEGTCGECRCRVQAGSVAHDANTTLTAEELAAGWVLACCSRVSGDVTLEAPETAETGAQIVTEELSATPAREALSPLVAKIHLSVAAADNAFSDLDRLTQALRRQGIADFTCGLHVLRQLAAALRAQNGEVTVTFASERSEMLAVEPGDTTQRLYGLAIDIGTTTCAVHLVDLATGATLGTASDYNAQLVRGADIISRINYAQQPARREELRRLVLQTLNALIEKLCAQQSCAVHEIFSAAVAGNTTMMHLLLGLDPEYIRLTPYTPTVNHVPPQRAREVGLALHPDAFVHFAPAVGSYVGGDITAGLLATALCGTGSPAVGCQCLPHGQPGTRQRGCAGLPVPHEGPASAAHADALQLFLDIGTNGEIVVGTQEWLMACACSAGPAFEGSGIGCGMRAAKGAIERFRLDGTGQPQFSVIGGGPPRGLCGSGLIDLIAELFRAGLLDPSGKFIAARDAKRIIPAPGARRSLAYVVASKEATASGHPILIDERDIQNLLRTKAAVFSACTLMLKAAGLELAHIERVYVAGGFGRHLDLAQAIRIGMLPDLPLERYRYLGNSSLAGARAMLVSAAAREQLAQLAARITYLELNTDPAYMDEYTAALFLPHTDLRRFPSARGCA